MVSVKHRSVMLSFIAVAVASWCMVGSSQAPSAIEATMTRKLASANKLLEGLAIEDFEMLDDSAARLELLSQEAGWQVLQTPEYRRMSDSFRHAVGQLQVAAKEKNLDAASLAYIRMTITCVDCHRHVRAVQ